MYRRVSHGWPQYLRFIVMDIICLQAAFIIAYIIRNGAVNPYADGRYVSLDMIFILADLVVVLLGGSFKDILKRGYYKEFIARLRHVALTIFVVLFYLFVTQEMEVYSRIIIGTMGLIYFILSYLCNVVWKLCVQKGVLTGKKNRMFFISTSQEIKGAIENIRHTQYATSRIVGLAILDIDMRGEEIMGTEVLIYREDIAEVLKREWIDEVFIILKDHSLCPDGLLEALSEMGITVHINMENTYPTFGQKQTVEHIGSSLMLTTSMTYVSARQACVKRIMDIAGGIVGCLFTLILCLIIGPIIFIKSPGPIFFSQVRIGRNGRKFNVYKFRSMYMDAEERKKELAEQNRVKDGMMFKLDWDPRIIGAKKLPDGTMKKGIGHFIRDWSIDEFPQFYNVLKGDMSLVGTRPPTEDEWEKYELHHRARLSAKPGITGLWQVSGRNNITDFEEVVKLDKQYISEWTIGLDIRILLQTVIAVVKRDGVV